MILIIIIQHVISRVLHLVSLSSSIRKQGGGVQSLVSERCQS